MKKTLFTLATLLVLLLGACAKPQPRTIETPAVAATNCSNLTITKAELTDSATVLSFHVTYRPGWWIKIDSASHLVADGKKYPITGSETLIVGEQFTMPESGEADFSLTFAPVPLGSETIDFTEGTADGWAFYGIDVTGQPADNKAAFEGLPKEIADIDINEVVAEPVLDAAPSELRFHVLGYRPEYGKKLKIYLNNIAESDQTSVNLDANGEGVLKTNLYGTTEVAMSFDEIHSKTATVFVAPGETTDIYISPAILSDYTAHRRDKKAKPNLPYALTNGHYAALNKAKAALDTIDCDYQKYNWRMNAEEYTAATLANRESKLAAINATALPQPLKTYGIQKLNIETLQSLVDAWNNLAMKYLNKVGDEGLKDSVTIAIGPDQYAAALAFIDGDDDTYLMQPGLFNIYPGDVDLKEAGAKGLLFDELLTYLTAYIQAKAAKLTDDDIKALEALPQPFFAKAAKLRQAEAQKAFEEAQKAITENPNVPDDKLFDAIVAKHKGKVVLVDLWNTWCGPCRRALKANEPLKTGELADDDIVWIYIADESSDMNQYSKMIKDIKGEHHMVNRDQIRIIRERFDVDGIPYYILVDRDGKAQGHPDYRDHAEMVKGIKAAL